MAIPYHAGDSPWTASKAVPTLGGTPPYLPYPGWEYVCDQTMAINQPSKDIYGLVICCLEILRPKTLGIQVDGNALPQVNGLLRVEG